MQLHNQLPSLATLKIPALMMNHMHIIIIRVGYVSVILYKQKLIF